MYQKVLVPLDGSELAECVLPHVESLAKGCQVKSIVFVRVAEPVNLDIREYQNLNDKAWKLIESEHKKNAQKYLQELVKRLKYPDVKLEIKALVGGVADSIADYASENQVDLIVIATHGRSGIGRWVWGSTADRILRSACVPVLMVRAPGCSPDA